MILVRRYSEIAGATIAYEVVERGASEGWEYAEEDWHLAAMAEARLAHFNIGFVDKGCGAWGFVLHGTQKLREPGGKRTSGPPEESGGGRERHEGSDPHGRAEPSHGDGVMMREFFVRVAVDGGDIESTALFLEQMGLPLPK